MEKLWLSLGSLAVHKAPVAKIVAVGTEEEVKITALGPVPSQAFTKALKEENRREMERAGYFINDDYKAPTMRSNIKKGKRK